MPTKKQPARKRARNKRANSNQIEIHGARQNNLKGIDLKIPHGKLTVVTGPSGSGKSSLAFQTIYAEGQRRYVETFSPYTRQFFERMDKPQVDDITGIPPAIAIEQQNNVRTTRSTVGTITEINDYLKMLFPRLAQGRCPECGEAVKPETVKSIVASVADGFAGDSVLITFGVPVPAGTAPAEFFTFLQGQGFLRVFVHGEVYRTDEPAAYRRKSLPAVVRVIQDRVRVGKGKASGLRLSEAVEAGLHFGKGQVRVMDPEAPEGQVSFSSHWHCAACDVELRPPTPGLFSFNNPLGACPQCRGFGRTIGIDLERALPDKSLSLKEGVVKAFQGDTYSECQRDLLQGAAGCGIDTDVAFDQLGKKDQEWVLYGDGGDPDEAYRDGGWYGVQGFFDWMETKAYKMHVRVFLSRYRSYTTCRTCRGKRLQPEALNYQIGGKVLPELWQLPVDELLEFFSGLAGPPGDKTTKLLLAEIRSRLQYLIRVGLAYLDLDRPTRTLSGGEIQRVNLTTCLGASLVNTLFVLDEPSIGLHPRDTGRLIGVMEDLRDKGNTLVVVEHEEAVIRAADNLVDIGPGRGEEGGELIFSGAPGKIASKKDSLTGAYLAGEKSIAVPEKRRKPKRGQQLKIVRASQNNLRDLDVTIPLGVFCCVTGVSGSGKSTLVHQVLYDNLMRESGQVLDEEPGRCKAIRGADKLGQVVMVDQSPLSRTPRSTPGVYTGAFELIRKLFAATDDAKAAGLTMGYFSFNSGTGRCERCWGNGFEKIEMQFLSDIFVRCPECEGRRYGPDAMNYTLLGESIADVLEFTVSRAIEFFAQIDKKMARQVVDKLQVLADVGLGYLRLGQPLNTLSGGESQRLKLVGHLLEGQGDGGGPGDLLIFDEPTTGLHFDDIRMLLNVFQRLVDAGNSLLVIEHNLDVIKTADHVIDLGPEGGVGGGELVGCGTPEELAGNRQSQTGRFLAAHLAGDVESLRVAEAPGDYALAPASVPNAISVHGAREHNLKGLDVTIPHDQFTVITGLSGSGKSTLAFDILFAEGQRRFLDSMSTYARQFVQQLEKPEVDHITGLPPTVAIEQRISRGGGKSTVATVTEAYHFLRLLFSKLGVQHCPACQVPVVAQTLTAIEKTVKAAISKGAVKLMAPVIKARKGFHTDVAEWAGRQGFESLFVDGKVVAVEGFQKLERFKEHTIDVVVAEFKKSKPAGLRDAIEQAMKIGKGTARLLDARGGTVVLSTEMSCPSCDRAFEELDPRLFSYNSPHGWCPACRGHGVVHRKTARWRKRESDAENALVAEVEEEGRLERASVEDLAVCKQCYGARLNEIGLNVHLHGLTIGGLTGLPVNAARAVVDAFTFTGNDKVIAQDILVEISQRLRFLEEVGLGYLELNRSATTLSGGESQRIRLAAQLGSNLRGVLYVLDEPTIGLHPRDNANLLDTLVTLRDRGNSLVVVEHDEETMRRSDHVIDLGPGAGMFGGQIVYDGKPGRLFSGTARGVKDSPTAKAFADPIRHPLRGARRKLPAKKAKEGWLKVRGASANNLKNVDVDIPLGRLTVISGISGSGKSSLMRGVIGPGVEAAVSRKRQTGGKHYKSMTGAKQLQAIYEVDQTPIGKTSRSTPATYVKVFDEIRKLFAVLPASKVRGYTASRFSFNSEGGRCETCKGNGQIKLEMAFLPTSYVPCEDCSGMRYNGPTLEIEYNGKNIGEVMSMTIEEAAEFFSAHAKIHRTLTLLVDTGLGYLQLGQPSPTLSGGDAQRIKLVTQLTRGVGRSQTAKLKGDSRGFKSLYLIEEPTIGLHTADVRRLLEVLHALVDDGHTVIVIEHNLDIIAEADFLIDIGPEAGDAGGTIVSKGTPEHVAKSKSSRTAEFIRGVLD
ncbi:MAG: excinuclease ABC subunit UvrA [Verrucomicrobiales bacterium]